MYTWDYSGVYCNAEQIKKLGEETQSLDYVAKTEFVSKEEAYNIVKERYSEYSRFLEGYTVEKNPFKAKNKSK